MKRFFWNLFVIATVLLALVYALACLTPLISAAQWTVMGYLGLGFPLLLATLLITIIVWCFYSRKVFIILLGILLLGSYQISHLLGWHNPSFNPAKAPGIVRIIGWNIQDFGHDSIPFKFPNATRFKIVKYLQQQQPDILCIQDFAEVDDSSTISNLSLFTSSLHLPYFLYSNTYQTVGPWGNESAGVAIFSKYPLHNAKRILYAGKKWPEGILQADITVDGVTRRIITTHLQSMFLKNQHWEDKMPWVKDEDSAINYSGSMLKKLNYYLPYHARQAQQLRRVIDASPYPVIFSADMNEVPSSYCYTKVKGGLDDVFLQKGGGLGRTYYQLSPTLRIDYLFTSPGTPIAQYKKDTPPLSDHYPQTIDVKW